MNVSRLSARPGSAVDDGALGSALLHVPPVVGNQLTVMLHGAGSGPRRALSYLRAQADRVGFLLLAPKSTGYTWDAIEGGFGPDTAAIDRALGAVFATYEVSDVTLAGFSDGASYALGLGLANGDLFRRVIAFSPGFLPPRPRVGRPPVFITHGVADDVLPVDRCSRRIVPILRAAGYEVDYHEFDGGHTVPSDLVAKAYTGRPDPP